jgi:hypothetical protein
MPRTSPSTQKVVVEGGVLISTVSWFPATWYLPVTVDAAEEKRQMQPPPVRSAIGAAYCG